MINIFKKILTLVLFIINAECLDFEPRMGGGSYVEPKKFPYMVGIFLQKRLEGGGDPFCGGAITSSESIVTAAHCFKNENQTHIKDLSNLEILAGVITYNPLDDSAVKRNVKDVFIHEEYDAVIGHNDIAVVTVTEPFPMSDFVKVIPLATKRYPDGTVCKLYGWGSTTDHKPAPEILITADMEIIPQSLCKENHSLTLHSQYCASKTGVSVCLGDSGGPLVCDGKLAGVTVRSNCTDDHPTLFMDVFYFKNFIQQHLSGGMARKLSLAAHLFSFLISSCQFIISN